MNQTLLERSLTQYIFWDPQIGVGVPGKYKIALDTDAEEFGGHKLLDHNTEFLTSNEGYNNRPHSLMVSLCHTSVIRSMYRESTSRRQAYYF